MFSEAASEGVERRLHPLSWLFTLLTQLRQFALPLIVVLFTGRGNSADLWGLVAVGVLVLISLAQYFTYRYRVDIDGVVIRSGIFQRNVRHIPFGRIQNVTLHQNVLHRLFGVAEVRLESAGAVKPEGQMRVLRLADAQRLEQQIRSVGAAQDAAVDSELSAPPQGEVLLALPTSEVLRLGLIDNRGLLVIGGAFAVLAQSGDDLMGKLFTAFGQWASGQANAMHLSVLWAAAAALVLLVVALVAVRLFSILIALMQFHGFILSEADGRLSVQRGLLSRNRASLPRHRIQAYQLKEGLLHRLLGRRSLQVDTAVTETVNERGAVRDLVPIATPETMDSVIDRLLPEPSWPVQDWQRLHPRAWRRKFVLPALLTLALSAGLIYFNGRYGALLLLLLPVLLVRAKVWARYSAWSIGHGLVAFRSGWIDRSWRFAEIGKLQAMELTQSPFDRRNGMATLHFDTAGAKAMAGGLQIPYLPEATARRLQDELSRGLATPWQTAPTRSRTVVSAAPAQ
jgi:putative membrane protein